MLIDRGAQVLDEQVRVGSGRDAHVAVAHEPLHAMDVDAVAEQLGGEGMAQIVEADLQRQRLGPEQAAAKLLRGLPGTVGVLHAVRAVPVLAVVVMLLVSAPAAHVIPALGDACARERVAENLLRVGFARPLRAVRSREEKGAWRVLHLVFDPRSERRGQR